MGKYKIVVFDLDGTLLDTIEDLTDATNYALATHGFLPRTVDEVRKFVGNGIRKLIERAVPEGTDIEATNDVFNEFATYYIGHCMIKTKAYDGIINMLINLKNAGFRIAILSNKNSAAVEELAIHYFKDYVDIAMGQIDSIPKKPEPDMMDKLCQDNDIRKEDIFYVGDSEVDYNFSVNSHVDYALVSWGFRDKESLLSLNPNIIFDSVTQLQNYLMDGKVL